MAAFFLSWIVFPSTVGGPIDLNLNDCSLHLFVNFPLVAIAAESRSQRSGTQIISFDGYWMTVLELTNIPSFSVEFTQVALSSVKM